MVILLRFCGFIVSTPREAAVGIASCVVFGGSKIQMFAFSVSDYLDATPVFGNAEQLSAQLANGDEH